MTINRTDVKNWELLYDALCLWVVDMDIPDAEKDIKLLELAVFDEHYRQSKPMKLSVEITDEEKEMLK